MQQGVPLAHFVERMAALLAEPTDECEVWPYGRVGDGYGCLIHPGYKTDRVHRIALIVATGTEGAVIRHKCRTPACFNPVHLEWGTQAENMADKVRDGTAQVGQRHPGAKLTDRDVLVIRERYLQGGVSHRQLANEYGVSKSTIGDAVRGRRWTHLEQRKEAP